MDKENKPSENDLSYLIVAHGLMGVAFPSQNQINAFAYDVLERYGQPAQPAASAEPEWIDDPHDIEQGMMRNPKYTAPVAAQEPVACRDLTAQDIDHIIGWLAKKEAGDIGFQGLCERIIQAFAVGPVAAQSRVPEPLTPFNGSSPHNDYVEGWNDCRDAMLAPAPTQLTDGQAQQDYQAFAERMVKTYGFCNWQCKDAWEAGKAQQDADKTGMIEQIASEWDGCIYDAGPSGDIDIGAAIRQSAASQVGAEKVDAQPVAYMVLMKNFGSYSRIGEDIHYHEIPEHEQRWAVKTKESGEILLNRKLALGKQDYDSGNPSATLEIQPLYTAAQPDPAMVGDEWLKQHEALMHRATKAAIVVGYGGEHGEYNLENAEKALMAHARKPVQPASGEDARDAARYRGIRPLFGEPDDTAFRKFVESTTIWSGRLDAAYVDAEVDAAMQRGGQP